jgi:hypothetical protein
MGSHIILANNDVLNNFLEYFCAELERIPKGSRARETVLQNLVINQTASLGPSKFHGSQMQPILNLTVLLQSNRD